MTQVTNASRQARGLRRITLWIPEEYLAKLDAICADSGYTRAEQVLGMIDADYDSMVEAKTAKPPRPKPRRSVKS